MLGRRRRRRDCLDLMQVIVVEVTMADLKKMLVKMMRMGYYYCYCYYCYCYYCRCYCCWVREG